MSTNQKYMFAQDYVLRQETTKVEIEIYDHVHRNIQKVTDLETGLDKMISTKLETSAMSLSCRPNSWESYLSILKQQNVKIVLFK